MSETAQEHILHIADMLDEDAPLTDVELKAKAMILEVLTDWDLEPHTATGQEVANAITEALCRALDQNEALQEQIDEQS